MTALGIFFIILAIGLAIAELHSGSGLLLFSGLISLIVGMAILFDQGILSLDLWAIVLIFVAIAGLATFILLRIIGTHRRPATTGKEDLKGKIALVKKTLSPEGTVFYQGEYWNAVSDSGKIEAGEKVIIQKVEGLMLHVTKINPGQEL